jgi:NADH-quinone oxidoreductase subunit N
MLALLLLNFCTDFLSFYIAIELQSLSFYVLATFNKQSEFCCEAGLKYFILGAFSSGLLLFGFVLFYLTFGSICFETIAQAASVTICLTAFTGVLFFFAALFFKIGVFPFHF